MVKRSLKYEGLLWRKTLKVIKACLYKTRCLTGSQCSLMSAGVICLGKDSSFRSISGFGIDGWYSRPIECHQHFNRGVKL